MVRKTGGLAAIMAGQPVVIRERKTVGYQLQQYTKAGGLHVLLVIISVMYVYLGAIMFQAIELPYEEQQMVKTKKMFIDLRAEFVRNVEKLLRAESVSQKRNDSLDYLIDFYCNNMMKLFKHPIAANYFDSMFYNDGKYVPLWNTDAALLFTATTIIPVGYGYIAPMTIVGKVVLCIYAVFGIPLALIMITDIGKFFCNVFFHLFKENVTAFMVALVVILIVYAIVGGIALTKFANFSMIDGIYFSIISIFTIGYGDIGPSIPAVIVVVFIVCGVILVTISIDVVAASVIHHVHFMGRHVGKARDIAEKMIMMAQKISISKGLGLGMAQLGAFARMGLMFNVDGMPMSAVEETCVDDGDSDSSGGGMSRHRKSTAFDPDIDFDLIDHHRAGSSGYMYGFGFNNTAFGDIDDQEDVFYT